MKKEHPLQKFARTQGPKVVRMEKGEDPKDKLTEVSKKVYTGVGGGGKKKALIAYARGEKVVSYYKRQEE